MKKALSILLALALLLTLAACGGDTPSSTPSSKADTPASTGSTAEETPEPAAEMAKEIDWYCSIIEEEGCAAIAKMFEEETGIKVNYYSYDSADFVQAFMVAANGGAPIDVMLLNGQDVRQFTKNGLLQEVGDLPYVSRLSEGAVTQYTLNGKLYALGAKGGNSSGIYVNKNVLEKYGAGLPKTLDDMVALNNKMKENGETLFAFGGGNKYMWPMWYFSVLAQTTGNKPIERTEAILRGEAKFTDEDSIRALEILQGFANEGMFQAGFNGTDSDGGKAVFINEQAAAFYGGTWETAGFLDAGMDNLELLPFPICVDGLDSSMQTGNASDGAWTIYTGIDPSRQSAAELFLDFVTRDETIESFRDSDSKDLRSYGAVTCNPGVPLPDDVDQLYKTQQEFMNTMTFTHLDWIYPPEITTQLQDSLQALTGLQITPEEAAQQMQDKMDELLSEGYDFDAVSTEWDQ